MGVGYSLDLRQKLISAWKRRGLRARELSELFDVGVATVRRWQRLDRETGSVVCRPHGGGRKRSIDTEQLKALERHVLSHPDWTDDEYTEAMRRDHGSTAGRSSIGRAIRGLGYSVKKRPSLPQSGIVPMSDTAVPSTSEGPGPSPLRVWFLWTKRARTSR